MTVRDERLNRPTQPKGALITTVGAFVLVMLVVALVGHHFANPGHPTTYTLAEYQELRLGLSFVQVGEIVGRGGQLGNGISSDPTDVTRIVLQNKDGSSMTLTFQNVALRAKTESGLH